MKLTFLLLFAAFLQVNATTSFSQSVSFTGKQVPIESVFESIEAQTDYVFFYNVDVLSGAVPISVSVRNVRVEALLREILKGQPLRYYIKDRTIFIVRKENAPLLTAPADIADEGIPIKGRVTDQDGLGLTGVSVLVKGTSRGTTTDKDGNYSLQLEKQDKILVFSFVGMNTVEVSVNNRSSINVVLERTVAAAEDVVITGLFKKSRSSYTGAAVSFTGEQLKAVSATSVLEALSTMTPGLVMVEENAAGSDPNRIPELLIRGVTSFANNNQSVNQPLIVRDGTIISIQDLYDMNINEIETVTVLKDASAAALYGARAANGVIVIERKKIGSGRMKVVFNSTSSFQFPDFSDYNILNAADKLEYERLAGLYRSQDNVQQQYLDSLYNEKFKEINRGVNTDWMAQPSRVGHSLDNSLRLFGGAHNTRYELNARYGTTQGVMRGDYRKRYGLGFVLEYYAPHGLSFTNRTTYSRTDTKNSPYGSFKQYTLMNPYDRIYDRQGNINKVLSWDQNNPLYEAQLGSYNKLYSQAFSNDFDARWNVSNDFRITTHFNLTLANGESENFLSPLSGTFKNETDPSNKGSMVLSNNKGLTYSGNIVLSYNKLFAGKSLLSVNGGGNLNHVNTQVASYKGVGFYSDDLRFINFAATYPAGSKPGGSQDLNADVAGFMNLNYIYNNRYYFDGVYQISGSSKFGANNRYGQFWSAGLGWNLHNEPMISADWINILKLRGSVGYTGKVSFASYQALTTYVYSKDLSYLNGIGAVPITIGNPDLKWERTLNYNLGLDISLWKNRFNFSADIYKRVTTDLLIDKTLAPSSGTMTGKDNLGEMENKGIEVHMDGYVINNSKVLWQLGANITHNRNKILKISEALKKQNEINNALVTTSPLPQYQEGESTTALKVVRSAGIDPATGQEVYIKLDGEKTFTFNPDDKVVVGDQLPVASGTLFSVVTYKRITAAAYFGFTYGGYLYNITRATKIEGSNPRYNADRRVFDDRWKEPGDITAYKNIADMSVPYHTTRFIEKENTLTLSRLNFSYELERNLLRGLGVNKLAVGISLNDLLRISTVKMERGTDYLYSRGFDINLNILF